MPASRQKQLPACKSRTSSQSKGYSNWQLPHLHWQHLCLTGAIRSDNFGTMIRALNSPCAFLSTFGQKLYFGGSVGSHHGRNKRTYLPQYGQEPGMAPTSHHGNPQQGLHADLCRKLPQTTSCASVCVVTFSNRDLLRSVLLIVAPPRWTYNSFSLRSNRLLTLTPWCEFPFYIMIYIDIHLRITICILIVIRPTISRPWQDVKTQDAGPI